ncbi:MAG TPA: Mur ligase domain-containing protein [Candidatus Saccharimonadales bacterium]|jgi:UDP-N-acetylmuramate--alanine ligase|nr:Mur ligase domain-containing protein [Candidatus Saccharimonadales bacterium]
MHVYFSGIGGAGMAPLAIIAHQAGYDVSGSDKQASQYLEYLKQHSVTNIHVGQSREAIAAVHDRQPIDWFVYTAAVAIENPDAPELVFCREQGIKISKRDELLNQILADKNLKMVAVAGTHGKTTTTAMVTYLFKRLGEPVSYLLPAKTNFAEMGEYDPASQYFVYEADEFDRNFLAFEPAISLITGVSWDHHEIFPTREDYQAAFMEFIAQSGYGYIWQDDADYLGLSEPESTLNIIDPADPLIQTVSLQGKYNRLDAWLAINAVSQALDKIPQDLIKLMNDFPGLSRRMEQIIPNLYSDYAHTPEKIRGAMSVALEMAVGQKLIVVYEPLTNRRQHYMLDEYRDCFAGAAKVYWLPSYLAREDPRQRVIPPEELISHLDDPAIAEPAERGRQLKRTIQKHLDGGDMVVGLAGGGGGSLDDWLRAEFDH